MIIVGSVPSFGPTFCAGGLLDLGLLVDPIALRFPSFVCWQVMVLMDHGLKYIHNTAHTTT